MYNVYVHECFQSTSLRRMCCESIHVRTACILILCWTAGYAEDFQDKQCNGEGGGFLNYELNQINRLVCMTWVKSIVRVLQSVSVWDSENAYKMALSLLTDCFSTPLVPGHSPTQKIEIWEGYDNLTSKRFPTCSCSKQLRLGMRRKAVNSLNFPHTIDWLNSKLLECL